MKFWNKVARLVRAAGVTSLLAIGAAGLGLSSAAHAQKVLILQTTETGTGDDTGAANIHLNMLAEFENAGASVTVQNGLQTAGTVDAATFNATPPYDLVVVSSVYQAPGAGNMSAIQAAVSARSANAFVFFMDGYVDSSAHHPRRHRALSGRRAGREYAVPAACRRSGRPIGVRGVLSANPGRWWQWGLPVGDVRYDAVLQRRSFPVLRVHSGQDGACAVRRIAGPRRRMRPAGGQCDQIVRSSHGGAGWRRHTDNPAQ